MAKQNAYRDGSMLGWIANTAKREHWRMAAWYSLEDLIQDGDLCFAKCWNRYRELFDVPEPTKAQRRHFMALVQTAYYNHIATLASKFALAREDVVGEYTTLDSLAPPTPEQASVLLALATLPADLADVVEKLVQDGVDGGTYLKRKFYRQGTRVKRSRRGVRETTSEYWTRILGVENVPERLADLIRG